MEHPIETRRRGLLCPVALPRVVLKRAMEDAGAGGTGYLERAVGAARIDHDNLTCPGGDAVQATGKIGLLVKRQNDHRDRHSLHENRHAAHRWGAMVA